MKNSNIFKFLLLVLTFTIGIQSAKADFSFSDMELRFAQVSDVYLSDEPDTSYKVLSHSKDLLRSLIKDLNEKSLDFVAFTGNMVNEPTKKMYRDFFLELSGLNYPSLLVFGNNDSVPDNIENNENGYLNKNTVYQIINNYNPYQTSDKVYFAYSPAKDFRVIVLDTTIGYEYQSNGFLTDEQLQFLDNEINNNQDKVIIIFQHHPVIEPYKSADFKLLNANAYLEILAKYKHTPIGIFSGHYHASKITKKGNVVHCSSPSITVYPNAYRTVVVSNYRDRVIFDIAYHETKLTKIKEVAKQGIVAKSILSGLAVDRNASILIRKRGLPGVKLTKEEKAKLKAEQKEKADAIKAEKEKNKQLKKEEKAEIKRQKQEAKAEAKRLKKLNKGN